MGSRMFSHSPLDWALVLGYFGFLAAVWLRLLGRRLAAVDYLVAGRRVTLPAFVATLVATWYGGILGVGEYSYRYGFSNWLVFGVPYYIGALLFAWIFARRAREAALYTIPDLLDRHYGRGPALLGALTVFVTSAPAAYVLMLGTLFAAMFGLPLVPCVVAAAALSLFYIHRGGLRTVVFTDQVQFVLDFLTTTTGLYARAVLPHLRDPVFAFPELARVTLPPLALGLFYLAMIATVMSTVDSYGFIAAGTVGRDLLWRLRGEAGEQRL